MNKGEWEKWEKSDLFSVLLSSLEEKKNGKNWINEKKILWWVYSQRLFLNLINIKYLIKIYMNINLKVQLKLKLKNSS